MNNSNIFINTAEAEAAIAKMREYRDNMQASLEKIQLNIKKLPDVWSGNVGDSSYEKLDHYQKKFEYIMNETNDYIDYLEKTKEAYRIIDEEINKKAQEHGDTSVLEY